jgi:Methyltransferase domain
MEKVSPIARVPGIDAPLTARMRADPPFVHAQHGYLGLAWPALEWLERNIEPSMTTLETGSGASTILFAARGASHTAISPVADEHARIVGYCEQRGISTERLRFIAASSHAALLHDWEPQPLDLVLIDGAHSFPFPILDWLYTAEHLRVGGRVLIDDAYQPAVNVLVRYLRASDAWHLEVVPGHRTPCFRKVSEEAVSFDWDDRALGRARFDYLPPARRLLASMRYWGIERTPLRGVVPRVTRVIQGRGQRRASLS